MSSGEVFYLMMAIVGASVFALVLAYYSHQSNLTQRRMATQPEHKPAQDAAGVPAHA